jgi:hypothetical protein
MYAFWVMGYFTTGPERGRTDAVRFESRLNG